LDWLHTGSQQTPVLFDASRPTFFVSAFAKRFLPKQKIGTSTLKLY
jgi:hypothetical protein